MISVAFDAPVSFVATSTGCKAPMPVGTLEDAFLRSAGRNGEVSAAAMVIKKEPRQPGSETTDSLQPEENKDANEGKKTSTGNNQEKKKKKPKKLPSVEKEIRVRKLNQEPATVTSPEESANDGEKTLKEELEYWKKLALASTAPAKHASMSSSSTSTTACGSGTASQHSWSMPSGSGDRGTPMSARDDADADFQAGGDDMFKEFWNSIGSKVGTFGGSLGDQKFLGEIEAQLKQSFPLPSDDMSNNPDCEESGLEKHLADAVKGNAFDMRGALGQRFNRTHKKGTKAYEEYNLNKTWEAKRLFRINWAKKALQKIRCEKKRGKMSRTIDANKGVYRPFAAVVEHQGYQFDPQGAVLRASRYASKCLRLGPPFCSFNQMTDTLEFLDVEREHREEFEQVWEQWQTQFTEKKRDPKKGPKPEGSGGGNDDDDDSEPDVGSNDDDEPPSKKRSAGKARAARNPRVRANSCHCRLR